LFVGIEGEEALQRIGLIEKVRSSKTFNVRPRSRSCAGDDIGLAIAVDVPR
jgi:hypothetical protein